MSKVNQYKPTLQPLHRNLNLTHIYDTFSDTEESICSTVFSPTHILVPPSRAGRMPKSINFYDLRGIQKNKIEDRGRGKIERVHHGKARIDWKIRRLKNTPEIQSNCFSKNQFPIQSQDENLFEVISSVNSGEGKTPKNLIHQTPNTQVLALNPGSSHDDITFSSSINVRIQNSQKLRKKMNLSQLGGQISRNQLRKGLISAHTAHTGNEIHSTQPSSVFNHLHSSSVTPKVNNKLLLPRLVMNNQQMSKSFFSSVKNEGRLSLRNSPRNKLQQSQFDMSDSKSTSQPNSRLYSRKTKLTQIEEKNEVLNFKLNKVEQSHSQSLSLTNTWKSALSPQDNLKVQSALNKIVDLSKRRSTLRTDIQPIPLVKPHTDDYHTFELSGVSFYRQENVNESRIPIEAVYNEFTEKIKTKELQRNQKHETKVVIVTPNKNVIKDYAEILVKQSNKRLSIPLNSNRRNSKIEVAKKWQKSIKKVINMMKFKSRNNRSLSPTAIQDMPGYYEAKAQRKENVKRLKSRYSKFATFEDFTKENLKGLEPLELVDFRQSQDKKKVVGPLASNEFELKLQEEIGKQKRKSKFMPRKKLSMETQSRRSSRVNFSRWYLDEPDRGHLKTAGKKIDLDIQKNEIGSLSISEMNLNKLPSTKSVIPPRIKQELMKSEEQAQKLGTIESESQNSETSRRVSIKLRRDPFKKIEKAVSLFSANLDQQIKLQLYEQKEEPAQGYDFLD